MVQVFQLALAFLAESWYQSLRWGPLGAPLLLALNRGKLDFHSYVSMAFGVFGGLSLLWHQKLNDMCLRFTPNIRSRCKSLCSSSLRDQKLVRVHGGFEQRVTRLLFEPHDQFWTDRERIEVQTILPDGQVETKSGQAAISNFFSIVKLP